MHRTFVENNTFSLDISSLCWESKLKKKLVNIHDYWETSWTEVSVIFIQNGKHNEHGSKTHIHKPFTHWPRDIHLNWKITQNGETYLSLYY